MKHAYQAASAGQQTAETGVTPGAPAAADMIVDRDKPRAKSKVIPSAPGLAFPRFFTEAGVDPFDEVEWEIRAAVIGNERGEVGIRAARRRDSQASGRSRPPTSSSRSTSADRSARPSASAAFSQLIGRVVHTITGWARRTEYFAAEDDLQAFSDDLKHILVYQKAAFNSPVWFNCGFEKAPQCSACFINSVQDTMDSILTLARTEGMLFKFGSGTGTNLSPIRSSKRAAGRWRHGVGPGVVHEGVRRVCRRHQVGRQDPARGEDGHPQRRSSRHRRLHQLQGRGREEGVGAHRRRIRRLVHRPGVLVGLLPELEQQRAGAPTTSCARCSTTARGTRMRSGTARWSTPTRRAI